MQSFHCFLFKLSDIPHRHQKEKCISNRQFPKLSFLSKHSKHPHLIFLEDTSHKCSQALAEWANLLLLVGFWRANCAGRSTSTMGLAYLVIPPPAKTGLELSASAF